VGESDHVALQIVGERGPVDRLCVVDVGRGHRLGHRDAARMPRRERRGGMADTARRVGSHMRLRPVRSVGCVRRIGAVVALVAVIVLAWPWT
jgi:hypothetical protein